MSWRNVYALMIALAALLGSAAARSQTYPERPVRIVVPFGAGGQSDVLTRILAQELSLSMGQSFFVDNKTGAGGNIGAEAVAKAKPDGYTLLLLSNGILSINPALYRNVPFDPAKDFRILNVFCTAAYVMLVNGKSSAQTVQDFVSQAKAAPSKLNFGSAGVGTLTHLAGELFRRSADIDMVHVPYKGGAEAEAALASGQVQAMFDSIVAGAPFVSAGTMRALAITDRTPSPTLPGVPTMAEAGLPAVEVIAWLAIAAPANTPPDVATLIAAKIAQIIEKPEVRERFEKAGVRPVAWTAIETDESIKAEIAKWGSIIRQAGITAN
jgi:tripartite-type tricarboxylate transporter receptor subunit TctC